MESRLNRGYRGWMKQWVQEIPAAELERIHGIPFSVHGMQLKNQDKNHQVGLGLRVV